MQHRILKLENAYQMVSSGEMADYITQALETRKPPKLSATKPDQHLRSQTPVCPGNVPVI